MNYKLTNDLIADCMALIPENDNWLHLSRELFRLEISKDLVFTVFLRHFVGIDADYTDSFDFRSLPKDFKFDVIRACLENIKQFDEQSPNYTRIKEESDSYFIYSQSKELNKDVIDQAWTRTNFLSGMLEYMPKTIASATLHGQGEYPPSTLEELCESYKNVMSK